MALGRKNTKRILQEVARLEHGVVHRPRPYPYNPGTTFTLTAGAGVNNFGTYVQLIPKGTFDFCDSPNKIRVRQLVVESISANDTFIVELSKYDEVTYTAIGAIRFVRVAPVTRSFVVDFPCRDMNNDEMALYGRLKSGLGGNNITCSLIVVRYLQLQYKIPLSEGVFPLG